MFIDWNAYKVATCMDKIKKYFDDFTFHARVMPILVMLLPIIILGCIKGIIKTDFMETTLYIVISLIFLTLMSKFARNRGKKYEKKMYRDLGGKPTTILMRFSDNTINNISKRKYHERLNDLIKEIKLPLSLSEESVKSDKLYEAAINWLRNYANTNREKEFRVYQELKEYNFWRNLYGIKPIALGLYGIIALRECCMIKDFNLLLMIKTPYPQYVSFWCMIISVLIVIFTVNKKVVNDKAFDYASTLIEVCETI